MLSINFHFSRAEVPATLPQRNEARCAQVLQIFRSLFSCCCTSSVHADDAFTNEVMIPLIEHPVPRQIENWPHEDEKDIVRIDSDAPIWENEVEEQRGETDESPDEMRILGFKSSKLRNKMHAIYQRKTNLHFPLVTRPVKKMRMRDYHLPIYINPEQLHS